MKRLFSMLAAAGIIAISTLGFAGTASASTAAVGDFSFESFSADYYLDVDDDGRSTLRTVETFVALFPESDQNHGMRRAIPEQYQGEPTDLAVTSVTDGQGNARPYEVETGEDGFALVTSAEKGFVHGAQTYVFTYTQHNVTRFFADSGDDEFYWDTVGTGWDQPFGSVTARIHIPTGLASSLNGAMACYQGPQGSTTTCDIAAADEAGGTVFTSTGSDLAPGENVSIAIGFEPGTFVARDSSFFGSPWGFLQVLAVVAGVAAMVWALVLRTTTFSDARGRPTIIAEYIPPKGLDLFVAAGILGKSSRAAAATFLDLAVKGRMRIVETPSTGFFSRASTYSFELLDATGLAGSELKVARALFGNDLRPGSTYLMSSKDTVLSKRIRTITTKAATRATAEGLRKTGIARFAILPTILALLAAVAGFVIGMMLLTQAIGGVIPAILLVPGILAAIVVGVTLFRTPFTAKGAEIRDHLKGLELYIRLAEADRLRMLQSPAGVEREAVSVTDPRQVLDIYEKLLPYAVLFSLEKKWAVELGRYYEDSTPGWYSGSGPFNAALFATSIGSMSSTASTSYSGSSSSSSSGGSGGGGFSGGGGGGGGGGGV